MPKKRRAKKKQYFTIETQEAIIRYNGEPSHSKRSAIYKKEIEKPIAKLVENIINTFKFKSRSITFEELQHEVVGFLVMNLGKYQGDKGKAFSYFSIVAKNYLIINSNNNYSKAKAHVDDINVIDYNRDVIGEQVREHKVQGDAEFMDLFVEYWDKNLTKIFTKDRDIKIAGAIVELFRNREKIENFNKKSLYIMIREMTNIKTQYITKVANSMKEIYKKLYREFDEHGSIGMIYSKFKF